MELLLGVGKEIVSPEIGGNLFGYQPNIYSKSLHDDLTVTAFAFTYGDVKAMLISATVCLIGTEDATQLRKDISEKTGIPANNVMFCCTHTHTGPTPDTFEGWGGKDEEYVYGILMPGVIAAAVKASQTQEPVTVGSAVGNSNVGINRRELTLDNEVILGQNPWGPYDPKMTILSFKNKAGKIVGNIISYGCHGTAAGLDTAISRDWSGIMTDVLEGYTGGITAFFNDTNGDVGPRISNGKTIGDISYVEELGKVAAKDAIRIFDQIREYESVSVSACSDTLRLPLEPRMPYEEAASLCDPEKEKTTTNLARKMLVFYRHVKESYENGYEEVSHKEIFQNIIRIGRFAFVAVPFELFTVVGLRIKEATKDLTVLIPNDANGYEGYFVTQDQICRGGYEIGSFKADHVQPYPDNADYHLVLETLRNLENLPR